MSESKLPNRTVVLVPCSGIGKTYGTVTREAAYIVTEDLRPGKSQIVPLSLLVLGDPKALAAVRDAQVITLDGCKLACATVKVGEPAEPSKVSKPLVGDSSGTIFKTPLLTTVLPA